MWMCIAASVSFTWVSRASGKLQSSDGASNHAVKAWGTGREEASAVRLSSKLVVVVVLESLSARMAESVDMRGRCCTDTVHPR